MKRYAFQRRGRQKGWSKPSKPFVYRGKTWYSKSARYAQRKGFF